MAFNPAKDVFYLYCSQQSQAISTEFLSLVPDALGKPRMLDRKPDLIISMFHIPSPSLKDLYDRLRAVISHTADAFTKDYIKLE